MREIVVAFVLATLAGCSTATVRGGRIEKIVKHPDGTVDGLRVLGPDIFTPNLKDVALPTLALTTNGATVGGGSITTRAPAVSVTWLFVASGTACVLGAVAWWAGSATLGMALLAVGAGLAGIALNPWIGAVAALGGLVYLGWSIYMARRATVASTALSRVTRAVEASSAADGVKETMRKIEASTTPVSKAIAKALK